MYSYELFLYTEKCKYNTMGVESVMYSYTD